MNRFKLFLMGIYIAILSLLLSALTHARKKNRTLKEKMQAEAIARLKENEEELKRRHEDFMKTQQQIKERRENVERTLSEGRRDYFEKD